MERELAAGLAPCRGWPHVADVRPRWEPSASSNCGEPVNVAAYQKAFVARVWVRPFGKLVYVMPPYVMSSRDVDTLTRAIVEVVRAAPIVIRQTASPGSHVAGKAGLSHSGRVPLGVDSHSGPSRDDGRLFRRGTSRHALQG